MSENSFSQLVQKAFAFLLEDYGFQIVRESYEPQLMGNAAVVLASPTVIVTIVKDRGQVLINMGEAPIAAEERLEFADIVRFFASDKNLDVYQFGPNPYDVPSAEDQVSRLAWLSREYCTPILRGDFSMRDAIKGLEKERLAELLKKSAKR